MSSDGNSRAFEIERRFRGHLPVPSDFKKIQVLPYIKDRYYRVVPSWRVREYKISFEYKDGKRIEYENPVLKGGITGKRYISGEIFEYDTSVGDPKGMNEILGMWEALVVTGSRTTYSNGEIKMTHDIVHRLGKFTEFEILEKDDEKRENSVRYLEDFISENFGLDPSQSFQPYPIQILQLEVLREIHYSPISKIDITVPKLANRFKCDEKTIRDLCNELEKLGYIIEKDGILSPPDKLHFSFQESSEPKTDIDPYISAVVSGRVPLYPYLDKE